MKQEILVIDDDSSVRHSLKRLLEVSGYSVILSTDGLLGLSTLKQGEFDLLLLDLDLPELRGWEILEFAVEHRPEIPVVLLTGLMNQCVAGSFAGTEAVLEKPTDVTVLLDTISKVLSESKDERLRRLRSGPAEASGFPVSNDGSHPGLPSPRPPGLSSREVFQPTF